MFAGCMAAVGCSLIIYFTCIIYVHMLLPFGGGSILILLHCNPFIAWNRVMGLRSSLKTLAQSLIFFDVMDADPLLEGYHAIACARIGYDSLDLGLSLLFL